MRFVSRAGLIAFALVVGAIVVPIAQASGLAGISSAPASNHAVVIPIRGEAISASISSEATSGRVTGSRDGVGEPRLRAAFAQATRPHLRNSARPTATSGSEGFQYGDAAVGAGPMAGLVLLGMAGALAARRRRQPLQP
jgi:MYXO-CTERM domain-containing protein